MAKLAHLGVAFGYKEKETSVFNENRPQRTQVNNQQCSTKEAKSTHPPRHGQTITIQSRGHTTAATSGGVRFSNQPQV
jgi:hypothetical protein